MYQSKALPCFVMAVLLFAWSCDDPVEPKACPSGISVAGACWTFLGLDGLRILSLADTPWGLYAGTRSGGLFRLNAETGIWDALGLDHADVAAVLFVPGAPARLLAGVAPYADETTEAAIYASENGGETWIPSDDALAQQNGYRYWSSALGLDPLSSGRVYSGNNVPQVIRSDDYGRTWGFVLGDEDTWGGAMNTIIGSPTGRVWVGGQSPTSQPWVGWTDDGGGTWRGATPLAADNYVSALLEHPRDPTRIWAAMNGGVMRSDQSGEQGSWKVVFTPSELGHRGAAAALTLVNDMIYAVTKEQEWNEGVIVAEHLGLYRTPLDHNAWSKLPVPEVTAPAQSMIRGRNGALLIGTFSGVWRVEP